MKTIGLDMSLTGTGISVLEGDVCLATTIKTKPKDFSNDIERLNHIVTETLNNITDNIDLICIEDYFIPQSKVQFNAAISLVALGTLIRKELYERKFPFITIVPSQLKKWILGKGSGQKSMVIKEVYKKLGLDAKDDNQADAIVLSYIAKDLLQIYKHGIKPENCIKARKDVLSVIINDRPKYNCEQVFSLNI